MHSALKCAYPGIKQSGRITVGGSQHLLAREALRHCGCGVVAALDLTRYLHLYEPDSKTAFFTGIEDCKDLPLPVYDLCAVRMQRNFIPVWYPVGTTGFSLATGLNRYFHRYHVPLKARWGVAQDRIWSEIKRMLDDNLPVILSVGNQFPLFWKKTGAQLYRCEGGAMKEAVRVHAHYVVVLEMDDSWLKISSWGKEYYLSKEEFLRYRDKESMNLLCNIVSLHRIVREEKGG